MALFSVYSLRPSKRLVMKNHGGAETMQDVLKKSEPDRQCLLSIHKLDESTIYTAHDVMVQSRHQFPGHFCGQERNGWKGSEVLEFCDRPDSRHDPTHLWRHVADFCSVDVFDKTALLENTPFRNRTTYTTLPHIESASLCAEACLALHSPSLCTVFAWDVAEERCHLTGQDFLLQESRSFNIAKWPHRTAKKSDNAVVAGVCRSSTIQSGR